MSEGSRTIAWKDGSRWTAPSSTFDLITGRLESLRSVILGLGPVLDRWRGAGATLDVDDLAPTEDDRAVLTAALARLVEEGSPGVGEGERAALEERIGALHELFVTDVTSA